jgi:DNA repair protein RadC
MNKSNKTGHRERLNERFIKGGKSPHTEKTLLELLLTYSIPQKDVLPLAKSLLEKFGSLSDVLSADVSSLCEISGVKISSAILFKLVDWIRKHYTVKEDKVKQLGLFDVSVSEPGKVVVKKEKKDKKVSLEPVNPDRGAVLFTKALLKEAISILPKFPDTESVPEIKEFLRNNLHFSSQTTRERYANYITSRLYPSGYADRSLRLFALKYQGRQELRDICFYRLCKAEPVVYDVIHDLIIPSIGHGKIDRDKLRDYLRICFPSSKSIGDGSQAIVEALTGANIARSDRTSFSFSYRQILLPSFAFILHSEFPESGIYDIGKLENNRAINSMLWKPDGLLTSLYELRNQGFISKISEIDSVRQFTTRFTLEEVVNQLSDKGDVL